jgi:hypothetical protein
METPKSQRAPQSADKYVLRLPDGMRDKIAELARLSNRSMNAEMVAMLQQSMDARTPSPLGIDVQALAEALAPKLAAEMRKTTD